MTIAFDTNVNIQESVKAARSALTQELRKRGAVVHWLHWPADTPAAVNGLDDVLALQGPSQVLGLIEKAKPYRVATPSIRVWTYTELVNTQFPPTTPVAEGFVNEGETVALVGKPKQGKSRLVQQFSINVSRGQTFLGHGVPKSRRVLILDFENKPARAKSRFSTMDRTADPNDNLLIYAPETLMENALTLANPKGLEQLIDEVRPDVLIIDNWRLFLAGDENNSEVVLNGLKVLSSLRRIVPTLAIVIVHHTRKHQQRENQPRLRSDPSAWVEAASGHSAFLAHVDACFGLERETEQGADEFIIFGGVARNASPTTLLLDEDEDTLLFRVLEGESAADKTFTPTERSLWSQIRHLRDFTFTDVVEENADKNPQSGGVHAA